MSQLPKQRKGTWGGCSIETPILVVTVASLVAVAVAASLVNKWISILAALAFAGGIIESAFKKNAVITAHFDPGIPNARLRAQFELLRYSTCRTCFICAWAAAALLLAYPIARLNWLHGWEYGLAFALAAAGFALYAKRLAEPHDAKQMSAALVRGQFLAKVEVLAVFVTLVWIIASGKLATVRGDWLANDVFVASGCAVLVLSVLFILRVRASQTT